MAGEMLAGLARFVRGHERELGARALRVLRRERHGQRGVRRDESHDPNGVLPGRGHDRASCPSRPSLRIR